MNLTDVMFTYKIQLHWWWFRLWRGHQKRHSQFSAIWSEVEGLSEVLAVAVDHRYLDLRMTYSVPPFQLCSLGLSSPPLQVTGWNRAWDWRQVQLVRLRNFDNKWIGFVYSSLLWNRSGMTRNKQVIWWAAYESLRHLAKVVRVWELSLTPSWLDTKVHSGLDLQIVVVGSSNNISGTFMSILKQQWYH